MSVYRRLISITSGGADLETWQKAMVHEAPVTGGPKACAECPLRVGGELEAGAKRALEQVPMSRRGVWKRWGCHASGRPCAGMRRLIKSAEPKR